jgi:peptidoglycan/LPS O-acetylase OafA/YrhL
VPELDGVRGIAIAAVMALHFVCSMIDPNNFVEAIFTKVTSYGVWGVDLFFVLSGYLITGILWDTRESTSYLRTFYVRRTLRIFPLYYAVLLVVFVLLPERTLEAYAPGLLEARAVQGWIWTYLTNILEARTGQFSVPYIAHFWSLSVEEHFYLVWPFVILWLSRRTAMAACIGLAAFSLVLRIVFTAMGKSDVFIHVLTPCRLDTLCTGAWFALALRGVPQGERLLPRPGPWLAGFAAVIVAASAPLSIVPAARTVLIPLRESALAVFFGVFILATAERRGAGGAWALLRSRALTQLGKYSYGLYVFHGMVAYGMERAHLVDRLAPVVGSRLASLLLLAMAGSTASIAIAVTSYELFESRFLKLKKHFESTPAPAPSPAKLGGT